MKTCYVCNDVSPDAVCEKCNSYHYCDFPDQLVLHDANTPHPLWVITQAGRVCYQSERTGGEAAFIERLISRGHESVLEHASFTFTIQTDRAVANELVRHRIASYSQESTRYCHYKDKVSFILPDEVPHSMRQTFLQALNISAGTYFTLLACDTPPEIARAVLPLCLKTEIVATMNVREWRHFLRLRTAKAAHPQMRRLAEVIKQYFANSYPILISGL